MGQTGSADRRNSLTKAQHFISSDQSDWGDTMEGYIFNGDYVGNSTLSKATTGVGVLQQPIKEQYLRARKQGNSRKVVLRLVQNGLAVSIVDAGGGLLFDMNSISYIECLRFAVLSGNDKKVRAMFVPLTDKTLPSVKDKNAFTIDKNYHFLTQINHPPLLAIIVRRSKGIKALDCHIFMLESVDDAYKIVSIIRQIQTRGSNPDLMTDVKQNDNNSFKRGQNNDVIRTEYGEYSVYRGQKQYELKDDYFRSGGPDGREGDYRHDPDDQGYGWSYERARDSGEENWRNFDNDQYDRHDDRYPVQMRGGSQNRGDYSYDHGGREYISHGRQRSSDSAEGRMNMSFSDSSERGGRYDDHGDRRSFNERERERGNISPRTSHAPPKVAEKPNKPDPMYRQMGPPSPGHHSPTQPLSPRSPSYQQHPGYNQPSPVGRSFPPSSPTEPVFSMSNLESRQTDPRADEEYQSKPVAKVPPHMVAGVKVLPTGFAPSAIKLKPKTAKHDKSYGSEDSDPDYDNNIAKYRKPPTDYGYHSEKNTDDRNAYNYSSGQGYSDGYGKGGDNYGRGDNYSRDGYGKGYGDNYNKGSLYDNNYGKDGRGGNYGADYGRQYSDDNRQYIENYDDPYGVQRRGSDQRQHDPRSNSNRYSVPSSVYDDRARDPGNRWSGSSGGGGQSRSHSNYDMSRGAPQGEVPKGKEAEIASMFTNFHIQNKGEHAPYATSGTDFEQSLGYLP